MPVKKPSCTNKILTCLRFPSKQDRTAPSLGPCCADLIPPISPPALRSRAGVPQTARPVPVALHRVGAGLHADHRQDAGTQPATNWHTLGPSDVRVRASTLYTQTHCKNILSTLPDITIQTVASILRILSPCYPPIEQSEEIRTDPRPTGDLASLAPEAAAAAKTRS